MQLPLFPFSSKSINLCVRHELNIKMLHILNYILSKKVKNSLIRLMNRMSASSL